MNEEDTLERCSDQVRIAESMGVVEIVVSSQVSRHARLREDKVVYRPQQQFGHTPALQVSCRPAFPLPLALLFLTFRPLS